MMKLVKMTWKDAKFNCYVDVEQGFIFSSDLWHLYQEAMAECGAPNIATFKDYVTEVWENRHYYTSPTFQYYNPFESDDIYQMWSDDEESVCDKTWTFFFTNIQNYDGDDFFEMLNHFINLAEFSVEKADALKRRNNNKAVKVVKIA